MKKIFNYKIVFPLLFCFQLLAIAKGQVVTLTEFPETLQFYGRDLQTNKAVIPIEGIVNSIGDSVSVVILKEGQAYSQQGIKPTSLNFELSPEIDAELTEYTIQLYVTASGTTTLYQTADSIVAGDVYIITGQSNSVARMHDGSAAENESEFIRVYGLGSEFESTLTENLKWFIGQGDGDRESVGNTGQWGLHMAKQIVDNQNIPVCIFNGARGGWPIINFIKEDADPENLSTNYGRLLYRLNRTNLANKVRALFWYQGENDASIDTPILTYKELFNDLYEDWTSDFPLLEQTYIAQIRHGCGSTPQQSILIQEALRQLAEELPNSRIVSTKGLIHDGCHFPYEGGYKELGDRFQRLISRDIYGENIPYASSPDIKTAEYSANNEIILQAKSLDTLIWEDGAHIYFSLEGSSANIIGGSTIENYIVLQLDSIGSDATGITYYDESEILSPFVINADGHGLVSFYNFPITEAQYKLNAKVLLEGFYDAGTEEMHTKLQDKGLLPLLQPFNSTPWNYAGTERAIQLPSTAVDWVLVMSRNADGTITNQAAGFIDKAGNLLSVEGEDGIPLAEAENQYFSIHTRSHLAILSANIYTGGVYDFTTDSTQAQGTEQLKLASGKYLLYAGDYDSSGIINSADFNSWKIQSAKLNEYLPIDGDGNGIINTMDFNLWINNRSKVGEQGVRY